jgi:non-canonical purine NTP pyrophosphatase (RdgB/HAM1 family)
MNQLYFITGNKNKFEEIKEIIPELERFDMDLVEIQDIDPRRIIEAKLKEALVHRPNTDFIVEDTSLHLECLKGLPGPLIRWFLETIGCGGLADIARLTGNARAKAQTYIGYARRDGSINFFEGEIAGMIVSPRGESNFGWDVIFVPDGHEKTFAELGRAEKQKISMRKIAAQKLKEFLYPVK